MKAQRLVSELRSLSFENTFNPYSDRCDVHDFSDAPEKRRILLQKILEAAGETEIDSVWIGRDLGYRGGRRTGLALTDDVHITHHGDRWGIKVDRPTKGQIVAERTASVIWNVLSSIPNPIFLWNVFPLHPYEAGKPFSNRPHNRRERVVGEEILSLLIEYLKPKRLIAIGNDAEKIAKKISGDIAVVKVRHPSYGGQTEFLTQTCQLYQVRKHKQAQLF